MFFIFRIVLILSIIGTAAALALIALKPVTARIFSAKWQYYIWVIVLAVMVFPIPAKPHKIDNRIPPPAFLMPIEASEEISDTVTAETEKTAEPFKKPDWRAAVSWAWALGACIYILSALISYWRFLVNKKRNSHRADIDISSAAECIGVKRPPSVRICADNSSPMLVGVIKPVIYLPDRNMDDCLNMVLKHELMHLKRRDLLYKWAALIVNGIHWFNPAAYMVTANINEFCEISCDIEVTKNMNDDEKKKYMQTILNLIHS